MIFKVVIISLLILIILSLGSALWHLAHDRETSTGTVRALTWRIGLSIFLFILLFVGFFMGWIKPHDITQSDVTNETSIAPSELIR